MKTDIHIDFFNAWIFLGIFQGFFLSWFFVKSAQNTRKVNLFQGLLLLSISLAIFEEWLNNTGLIVKVLWLTNFSEPLNFVLMPLFYFYIKYSLYPDNRNKVWIHLIPALFWTLYMVFPFIQSDEFKYNSYVESKHPEWGYLEVNMLISDDPLRLRNYVNEFTVLQFLAYMVASIIQLLKKFKILNQRLFATENELLIMLRNTTLHFIFIIILFIGTKIYFGMQSDVGGYMVASYVSFMIWATSYRIMNRSDFFKHGSSFFTFPLAKYRKSSLSDEDKEMILSKIRTEMEKNSYFTNNLASLAGLSKQINESSHHVSQVINEKLNQNFFDLLANYRVEYAKKLLSSDKTMKLTVEELAEQVGYNSKSSFNIAFKKLTAKTPSEYRKSVLPD